MYQRGAIVLTYTFIYRIKCVKTQSLTCSFVDLLTLPQIVQWPEPHGPMARSDVRLPSLQCVLLLTLSQPILCLPRLLPLALNSPCIQNFRARVREHCGQRPHHPPPLAIYRLRKPERILRVVDNVDGRGHAGARARACSDLGEVLLETRWAGLPVVVVSLSEPVSILVVLEVRED